MEFMLVGEPFAVALVVALVLALLGLVAVVVGLVAWWLRRG
ncbi:hypothetical protein ACFU7T_19050 [Streptomyces sp. NPDC057555]